MGEKQPRRNQNQDAMESALDPEAVAAFDFLTNKIEYDGMSYDEVVEANNVGDVDHLETVEVRRGNRKSENTLYVADLLVGSKYSDNKFFNQLVETVDTLPSEMKPDKIVMSGMYMGDFGGRQKNSRWMLQNGARTLDDQFRFGKEKLDQLSELGVPVVYAMSDNDTAIVEEMTFEAFEQLHKLAKAHARQSDDSDDVKRQLSRLEKAKANPNWSEYYRFTQHVVFPYCVRNGRTLYSKDQVSALTDGRYSEPEREILYDAYKRKSHGRRLNGKHSAVLNVEALNDTKMLQVVEDFEMETHTRGADYTDLIRHKFNPSNLPLSNYFNTVKTIRGALAADGKDPYDNIVMTGQHETAAVLGPDNKGIISIGAMQDPYKALKEKGHIFTSSANKMGREILGRKRINPASALSVERRDDGTEVFTIYNKHLMELSDTVAERTMVTMVCDWQAGNLSARPDYQIKHLDMIKRRLGRGPVMIALGGDMVEGRNYSDFPRESGRTGLMGMDQQFEFVRKMLEESFENFTREDMRNMTVRMTIGNHEWNSGTVKWNGYSFVEPITSPFKMQYARHGFSNEDIADRVQFHDTIVTPSGEPLKTYETTARLGELGIAVSHYYGAGKGTGGQPPAFTAVKQNVGLSDWREGTDVQFFGHYHHGSFLVSGNKLIVGAGSLAGPTGFEYEKGLHAAPSIIVAHFGGGLPPQIEVIGQNALDGYKIPDGPFSDKVLRQEYGHRTDSDFDAGKHTPFVNEDGPKSALMKRVLELGRKAAFSDGRTGYL